LADVDVKAVINELFSIAGVKRVISIDDMNAIAAPVEDALTLAQTLGPDDIKEIFGEYPAVTAVEDLEIRLSEIRKLWDNEGDDTRRVLLNRLRVRKAESERNNSEGRSVEVVDENTFLELPSLFAESGLELMSLKQWRDKRDEILSPTMVPTLLMVDEDFSKEDGGTRDAGLKIIREVMNAAPADKILCALLSHNPRYQAETLHESWKTLCQTEGLSQSRFVLIPKKLIRDHPMGFAWLIKLALLNGRVDELKTMATNILRSAEENARKRLDGIDIYDLDQILFRSSWQEGVWEPDTLFRVFGLLHHDETRTLAKENADLYKLTDAVRAISLVSTKYFAAPSYNTMALERLERYEPADYLNSHFIPIELGDIFQRTGDSTKRYILLAQSCDLMVRASGRRNPFTNEGMLAEIVAGPIKDQEKDSHGELQFLDESTDTQNFVSFKRTHSVRLTVLDMCAFNASGEASLELRAPCPDRAIPAWKVHYEKLVDELGKTVRRVEELTKNGVSGRTAGTLLARCSNSPLFVPTVDVARQKVSFTVKRVGRLRQSRAAALLSRYANFMARQAFDHDFGERKDEVTTESVAEQVVMSQSTEDKQTPAAKSTTERADDAVSPVVQQQKEPDTPEGGIEQK
jgi:hypothetical protein